MMIFSRIKKYLKQKLTQERSPRRLALSLSVGIFLAFTPFLLMHSLLAVVASWFLGLNFPITFAIMHLIHNPWATLPIYASGYMVGDLVLHKWLGLNTVALNPEWMNFLNIYITKYVGLTNMSLTAFLVGGNLLGLALALGLYPLMKIICARYLTTPSTP